MKHTPGPWDARNWEDPQWMVMTKDQYICSTVHGNDEANAHLIAAAPDLLEACKIAFSLLPGPQPHDYHKGKILLDDLKQIEQAIAKAEGK